nr:IS630 family transposase [Massilia mucilaginosa]
MDTQIASRASGGAGTGRVDFTGDGAILPQKNDLKPWQKREWCTPEVSGDFVAAMEDVLDLYDAPYDAQRPVTCFDETPRQLIDDARPAQPMQPGQPAREDTEYVRCGVADIMLFCEPATGRREAWVTERRTKADFARAMERLVETYPHAEVIRVVMDNLNTHKPGSLYDTFPPEKANALLKKLEFHYTPKHGSWLNMAEIEFAALSRQCLDRRTSDITTLARLVNAWKDARNQCGTPIRWQFTSRHARETMARCYPSQSTG